MSFDGGPEGDDCPICWRPSGAGHEPACYDVPAVGAADQVKANLRELERVRALVLTFSDPAFDDELRLLLAEEAER